MKKFLPVSLLLAGILIGLSFSGNLHGSKASAYDLFVQTASVTVSGTNAETTLIGSGVGSTTIPASYLQASDTIKIIVMGHLSSAAITPGTLRIRFKLGATTIADTGAQTMASGVSNSGLIGTSFTTCRTIGANGSLFTQGRFTVPSGLLTDATWPMVNTAAATVDTTSSKAVDVTSQFSSNSGSNSLTVTNLHIMRTP